MKTILFLLFLFTSVFSDKLEILKDKQFLLAGVKYDYQPFGFVNEKGRVDGFDIDLIKYIATKLDLDVKFKQVTSANRIKLLKAGEVDILAASMTHTFKRDREIDFSMSYFFDGQALLVDKKDAKKTFKDLKESKVGAIRGSTSAYNFKKLFPKSKIILFNEYPQALRSLKGGHIDAITTDLSWCILQSKNSDGQLKVLSKTFSYEPYGIGIIENESNFLDAINEAIADSVIDGTYANIYEKWFGELPSKLPEVWSKQ